MKVCVGNTDIEFRKRQLLAGLTENVHVSLEALSKKVLARVWYILPGDDPSCVGSRYNDEYE